MSTPPSLHDLVQALQSSWSADTSFTPDEWSKNNPARGQCVVSSLVVQAYLGGELKKYRVTGPDFQESHYCNILDDGTILDTTGSQYKVPVTLATVAIEPRGYSTIRERLMSENDMAARYATLKQRVEQALATGDGVAVVQAK